MILRACIRPKTDPDAEHRYLRVEAPDYDTALAQITAQTPNGWIRIWLNTGDDESTPR